MGGKLGRLTDKIEHTLSGELNPLYRKIRALRDDAKLVLIKQLLTELPDEAWPEVLAVLQVIIAQRGAAS